MNKKFKKKLLWILVSAAMATFAVACVGCKKQAENPNTGEENRLEFTEQKIEIIVGETKQLSVLSLQENETVTYASNDENVAMVSNDGLVEGKSVGSAVVKATTSLNRSALAQVIVYDKDFYPVPYISVSEDNLCLSVGDQFILSYTYTYLGENLEGEVTFSSGDDSIVSVDNGTLTAKSAGSTTVTLKGSSSYGEARKVVKVTVMEESAQFYPSFVGKEFFVGRECPLEMYVNKGGALTVLDNVTFTTADSDIVKIENGKLLPLQGGDALINVSFTYDGVDYVKELPIHVYGKKTCTFTYLDGSVDHSLEAICGDIIPLYIVNADGEPEYKKEIKAWYVNGEPMTGEYFVMPDEDVEVSIRFVNDSDENFLDSITQGHLLNNLGADVEYVVDDMTDDSGNVSEMGGYVRVKSVNWGSVNYYFDTPVVVNAYTKVRLRLYMPSETLLLYFGVATEKGWEPNTPTTERYGVNNNGIHHTDKPYQVIKADAWQTVEIPLDEFVGIGEKLSGISIATAPTKDNGVYIGGGDVYIDYISVYQGLFLNDAIYMDNMLCGDIFAAENGSIEQMEAINKYYEWAETLKASERASETHQTNIARINALVAETYNNVILSKTENRPTVSGEKVSYAGSNFSGATGYNTNYKTAYTTYHVAIFDWPEEGAKTTGTVALNAINYNEYGQVSFGLYSVVATEHWDPYVETTATLTINGETITFNCQATKNNYKVVIADGVLTITDDHSTGNGETLLTVELPESVLNGTEGLTIGGEFEGWGKIEVTEMYMAKEIAPLL